MRIAFFGGSFDPPHRGHLAIADAALERLALDLILVAPVGQQPLKGTLPPATFEERMAMTDLATRGNPQLALSQADAPRADGKPNYTFDTLTALKGTLEPGDALAVLLGADSFLTMKKWHRATELLLLADFVVAARPGFNLGSLEAALPPGFHLKRRNSTDATRLIPFDMHYESGRNSRLYLLPDIAEEASATAIRSAIAGGSVPQDLIPPAVLEYIQAHHLYQ